MVTTSSSSFSVCPVALSALFILVDSPSQLVRFRPLLLFSLCPAALRLMKTESVEREKQNKDQRPNRFGSARLGSVFQSRSSETEGECLEWERPEVPSVSCISMGYGVGQYNIRK